MPKQGACELVVYLTITSCANQRAYGPMSACRRCAASAVAARITQRPPRRLQKAFQLTAPYQQGDSHRPQPGAVDTAARSCGHRSPQLLCTPRAAALDCRSSATRLQTCLASKQAASCLRTRLRPGQCGQAVLMQRMCCSGCVLLQAPRGCVSTALWPATPPVIPWPCRHLMVLRPHGAPPTSVRLPHKNI